MTGINLQSDDQSVDTDIFVVIENKNDCYDFVTIDEEATYDAIVIDITQDDSSNAIMIDFDNEDPADSFVSIDEDQVFISEFTADDLLINFNFK